jgi:hypothetical protein
LNLKVIISGPYLKPHSSTFAVVVFLNLKVIIFGPCLEPQRSTFGSVLFLNLKVSSVSDWSKRCLKNDVNSKSVIEFDCLRHDSLKCIFWLEFLNKLKDQVCSFCHSFLRGLLLFIWCTIGNNTQGPFFTTCVHS